MNLRVVVMLGCLVDISFHFVGEFRFGQIGWQDFNIHFDLQICVLCCNSLLIPKNIRRLSDSNPPNSTGTCSYRGTEFRDSSVKYPVTNGFLANLKVFCNNDVGERQSKGYST